MPLKFLILSLTSVVFSVTFLCLKPKLSFMCSSDLLLQEKVTKYKNTIFFDASYTDREKGVVIGLLEESSLRDLTIFREVLFQKTDTIKLTASAHGSGVIEINRTLFEKQETAKIKRALGHELGHLVDYWVLTDADRMRYAKLRGIEAIAGDATIWFGNSDLESPDIESDQWRQTPAEDFAEVFYLTFFDSQADLKTAYGPVTEEVKSFIKTKYEEGLTNENQTRNTQEAVQATQLPLEFPQGEVFQDYGPWFYIGTNPNDSDELVYVRMSKTFPQYKFYLQVKNQGYDLFESYFVKAADEIISTGTERFFILKNQGKNKDFELCADGEKVLMENDLRITRYDLVKMMGE